MAGFLAPVRAAESLPDPHTQHEAFLYVRSFLLMRVAVGVLGVSLPIVLVFVDKVAFDGDAFPRGSLSAYYYSGMRDVFVGALSAIGVFLIGYKISERNLDNTASVAAGLSAGIVALFPTARPEGSTLALTPLQDLLGENAVKWIHFGAGGLFVGLLALLSYYFGVRSPPSWRRLHWACTAVLVLAVRVGVRSVLAR
jgi:hypothetical protein